MGGAERNRLREKPNTEAWFEKAKNKNKMCYVDQELVD